MDAAITVTERLQRLHTGEHAGIWDEPAKPDYRARHIANAREWLRRHREAMNGQGAQGCDPDAIFASFLTECKRANVDPLTILPAVLH